MEPPHDPCEEAQDVDGHDTEGDNPENLEDLEAVCNDMIGSKDLREETGKIAYELFPDTKRVSPTNRAYLVASTIEQPRQADAPPAAAKIYEGQLEPHQIVHKRFVSVSP